MYQYAVPDSAKDEALIHSKALKYADSFTTESKQEFSIIPVKSIGVLASDIDLVCDRRGEQVASSSKEHRHAGIVHRGKRNS